MHPPSIKYHEEHDISPGQLATLSFSLITPPKAQIKETMARIRHNMPSMQSTSAQSVQVLHPGAHLEASPHQGI
jgi:hypothetical protein